MRFILVSLLIMLASQTTQQEKNKDFDVIVEKVTIVVEERNILNAQVLDLLISENACLLGRSAQKASDDFDAKQKQYDELEAKLAKLNKEQRKN